MTGRRPFKCFLSVSALGSALTLLALTPIQPYWVGSCWHSDSTTDRQISFSFIIRKDNGKIKFNWGEELLSGLYKIGSWLFFFFCFYNTIKETKNPLAWIWRMCENVFGITQHFKWSAWESCGRGFAHNKKNNAKKKESIYTMMVCGGAGYLFEGIRNYKVVNGH